MKTMSLSMMVLSLLTATSAMAAPSEFRCVNTGYRDDAFEVGKYEVILQQTNPEGGDLAIAIAEQNLGLEKRLSVRSVSLILDRDQVCNSTQVPYVINCAADELTGHIMVNGYVQSKDGVSAKINVGLRSTLKNVKLKSVLSSRSPVAIGGASTTVELNQLGVTAEALVEINGQQFPIKWNTHFETKNEDADFTYCKAL